MGIRPTTKPKKQVSLLKALNPKPWYKRKRKIRVRINAYLRNRLERKEGLYSTDEIRKARRTIDNCLHTHSDVLNSPKKNPKRIRKTLAREERFLNGFSKAEQKLRELAKKAQSEPTRTNQWRAIYLYSAILKELDEFIGLRTEIHQYELSKHISKQDSLRSFADPIKNMGQLEALRKIKESLENKYRELNIR